MKRKRIKVDWEALEDAFATHPDEPTSYLDTVTGHVHLEGEGEEDELDDDEGHYGIRAAAAVTGRPTGAEGTRLPIQPPDTAQKIEWLQTFLQQAEGLDKSVLDKLRVAMKADDPAEAIGAILRDNPDESAAWFLYRGDRLQDMIDRWLKSNEIDVVDPPPWK